uniref:latent-transforming growth factor beta-binding protein 1-like n=1 Tax=Styela clava TaxID=7725 RepID=UPI00193A257D|nr:latent-transforming growth factor beta-binding protein 1-like [Styela clava]
MAWGSSCSRCPERTSDDYRFLCQDVRPRMRPPPRRISAAKEKTVEVNEVGGFHEQECGIPGGCKNGKCLRTEDGYTCDCDDGFILDPDLMVCSDVDECKDFRHICLNGICINQPGSFKCVCRPGFEASNDDSTICKEVEPTSFLTDLIDPLDKIQLPAT